MRLKSRPCLPLDPYSGDPWSWTRVIFRRLDQYLGYGIDSDGITWGCRMPKGGYATEWRRLKGSTLPKGYKVVNFSIDGKYYPISIHRLVLETFVGPAPEGMETRHINGISSDNRLANLRWGTHSENEQDKLEHGTYYARITANEIDQNMAAEILELHRNTGMKHVEIASRFGISRTIVGRIIRGENWSFKTGNQRTNFDRIDKKGTNHHNAKMSEEQVIEMRRMRSQGATYDEIEVAFGINRCSAWRICNYKGYTNIR